MHVLNRLLNHLPVFGFLFGFWFPLRFYGIGFIVKFSKDFLPSARESQSVRRGLKTMGWWTLNAKKMCESRADLWVLVLYAFSEKASQYAILPPQALYERLTALHGEQKTFQSYLWVTKEGKCWETRGLSTDNQILIANKRFKDKSRDFTEYLNNWQLLERGLR